MRLQEHGQASKSSFHSRRSFRAESRIAPRTPCCCSPSTLYGTTMCFVVRIRRARNYPLKRRLWSWSVISPTLCSKRHRSILICATIMGWSIILFFASVYRSSPDFNIDKTAQIETRCVAITHGLSDNLYIEFTWKPFVRLNLGVHGDYGNHVQLFII